MNATTLLQTFWHEKTADKKRFVTRTRTSLSEKELREFMRWLADMNSNRAHALSFPELSHVRFWDGSVAALRRKGGEVTASTLLAAGMKPYAGSVALDRDFVGRYRGPVDLLPEIQERVRRIAPRVSPADKITALRKAFTGRRRPHANPTKDRFLAMVEHVKNLPKGALPPEGSVRFAAQKNAPPLMHALGLSKQRATKFAKLITRLLLRPQYRKLLLR